MRGGSAGSVEAVAGRVGKPGRISGTDSGAITGDAVDGSDRSAIGAEAAGATDVGPGVASADSDAGLGTTQPPKRSRHEGEADGPGSGARSTLGDTAFAAGAGSGSTAGFFLKKLNMLGRKGGALAATPRACGPGRFVESTVAILSRSGALAQSVRATES